VAYGVVWTRNQERETIVDLFFVANNIRKKKNAVPFFSLGYRSSKAPRAALDRVADGKRGPVCLVKPRAESFAALHR